MIINAIEAYTIFDSRGNPTVEVEVQLNNGITGKGVAPSGASTGQYEAHELRDGDPLYFDGKSVNRAIGNVNGIIAPELIGKDPRDQKMIDELMIKLDGTPNKIALGANAILAVSTAVAAAAANALGFPLFAYLGKEEGNLLPIPEIQIIGGGAHAQWRTDVQDFLLIANGANSYEETLEITSNVFRATGEILKGQNRYFGVADEGGYWPEFESHAQIFETFIKGIEKAGYRPGTDASIALDIAASDLYDEKSKTYRFRLENKVFSQDDFFGMICGWLDKYPIISIEDPFADTDLENWKKLTQNYGDRVQIIGDDLFTTNPERIKYGIQHELANAVLVKLNQIGTVTETLEAIQITQNAGWRPVISARSGETEDSFISHLAVASNAGQLKVGSFTRSERMAKWNEVLRIKRVLASKAQFQNWHIV
ncbi:phosphopyruvate hydratase [Ulvibacterium sp.]|uniref:phosphopyruvate hydratase n=1 Tax=Ulvibacterium sp. TaxID=2665914 RepID=UPI00262AC050|nr:phosphopyruvate hydratase [Ulvibacterium sp.]